MMASISRLHYNPDLKEKLRNGEILLSLDQQRILIHRYPMDAGGSLPLAGWRQKKKEATR
jgi:hypothetical protein